MARVGLMALGAAVKSTRAPTGRNSMEPAPNGNKRIADALTKGKKGPILRKHKVVD